MTPWRARCLAVAAILLAMYGHAWATDSLPNTPAGMLLFHGSAALVDGMILLIVPRILQGRLLDRTQYLLIASVVGNFAGWLLYMGYAPPGIYNGYMWALTVAQIGCLLFTDRPHADSPWLDLVRHRDRIVGGDHT